MKLILITFQIIFLVLSPKSVLCQNESSLTIPEATETQTCLSGELFSPAIPLDNMTYYNNDWLNGDIFLEDGRVAREQKIKYNGLLDELFWLEPKSNQTVKLDKEYIWKFYFLNTQGDTAGYFRKLRVKGDMLADSNEIFGEEIFHGEPSLFVLHSFYFVRIDVVPMNKSYTLKDIYEEDPVYYISFSNREIIGIRRFSRKNIYSLFPDNKDLIKGFLNKNMPGKIKTTDEIIRLMQFLNSIPEL